MENPYCSCKLTSVSRLQLHIEVAAGRSLLYRVARSAMLLLSILRFGQQRHRHSLAESVWRCG